MRRSTLLIFIPFLFLLIFFFYPVSSLLYQGVWDKGPTGRYLWTMLSDQYYQNILGFTTYQAFLSALLTMIIGLPGAYIIGNYDFRGKSLIKSISTVPFILPSIIVVIGFIAMFGKNGILNSFLGIFGLHVEILYTLPAILLAHAFYNFPVVMRIVGSGWENISSDIEDSARVLGASKLTVFRKITLPLLRPHIISSFMLVFAYCFMSFAIVLILGGGRYSTIEVEIWSLSTTLIRPHLASALAIIQIAFSSLFLIIYLGFSRGYKGMGVRRMKRIGMGKEAIAIYLYGVLIFILIFAPMISVAYYSFLNTWGGSLTLRWYSLIFSSSSVSVIGISPAEVIMNSVFFAFMTVIITVPMGILTARSMGNGRLTGALAMLPMAVSSVTLGWAFISAFLGTPLYGSWLIIVIAHSVIAFPLVFRSIWNSYSTMDRNLIDAARTLGASPFSAFLMVELPQILPGIIVGATFAFAISLGEFGATLLLYRPEYTTIPIAIYKILGTRAFGSAAAMSVILMVLATASFLLIDRLGGKQNRSAF